MVEMEKLESIFNTFNLNKQLCITKNYLKELCDRSLYIPLPKKKQKFCFFRSRMYFRIKELNINLENLSSSRKRKISKIISSLDVYFLLFINIYVELIM